jgi:uncharacterized protein (TIGR00255 family)
MSIRSMTGFGRAALSVEGVAHTVEIRSVNHRYLDLKLRLPAHLAGLEAAIRAQVRQVLHRGRVDLLITSGAGEAAVGAQIALNADLADQLLAAGKALSEQGATPLSADFVLGWPGVLQTVPKHLDDAALAEAVLPAISTALAAVVEMRLTEGAALATDLLGHLQAMETERAALLAEAPGQVEQYQKRLHTRIDDLLSGRELQIDQTRLLHEVAVFAERSDVAEELSRLTSHFEQFTGLLERSDPVGRRLDFLCQEMLREANTIASKVQDAGLSARAIELKAHLEQLREQAQNVE